MFRSVIYNCSQQQQPYSGHVYLDRSCSSHLWDDCRVQTYHSVTVLLFRSLKTTATLVNYTAQSGIKLAVNLLLTTQYSYVCVSLLFLWSDQCHFFLKAPLTRTDTLTLAGSLKIKNGNGTGSVSLSERRILSHKAWGEVSLHCLILIRGTLRSHYATAMRMSKKQWV